MPWAAYAHECEHPRAGTGTSAVRTRRQLAAAEPAWAPPGPRRAAAVHQPSCTARHPLARAPPLARACPCHCHRRRRRYHAMRTCIQSLLPSHHAPPPPTAHRPPPSVRPPATAGPLPPRSVLHHALPLALGLIHVLGVSPRSELSATATGMPGGPPVPPRTPSHRIVASSPSSPSSPAALDDPVPPVAAQARRLHNSCQWPARALPAPSDTART